ncbi:MAG: response regulator [Cyanobacteriota bacterium]
MQGTLNEIDIRSILQLIELGQRTGELFVQSYSYGLVGESISDRQGPAWGDRIWQESSRQKESFWFVFCANGQIVYAADSNNGNLLRLRDYLRRYKAQEILDPLPNPSIATMNSPVYAYLWHLLENHVLTPAQGRNIIQSMVNETLFDLLSLHQGSFIFETGPALAPQLTTLEIAPLVTAIMKQIQQWKQFHPHIQSPHQCPLITNSERLQSVLPENTYKSLECWADGTTSLRQFSRYLNRPLLTVAKAIYPYVEQGWIQLLGDIPQETPIVEKAWELRERATVPRICCIDDDLTIGKSVESILAKQGYEFFILSDPIQSLTQVFQIQPDLILCDIAMPELDGYEICGMLRRSTLFRQIPIIMLTGKEGFIDRVRARMVGSTDYLTKPFGESELLMLLEKYLGFGNQSDSRGEDSPKALKPKMAQPHNHSDR